jgi:hypothetical protein
MSFLQRVRSLWQKLTAGPVPWQTIAVIVAALTSASLPFLLEEAKNLEFEYVFLTSIIAPFMFVIAAIALPTKHILLPKRAFFDVMLALVVLPIVVLIPAWARFISGTCRCSINGFHFWVVIQLIPSLVMALGLFRLVSRLRTRFFMSRWHVSRWLLLGAVLLLIANAAVLWFMPQKRLVSMILGFVHGPIYDEWIPVDYGVILARLFHLLFWFSLIVVLLPVQRWYRGIVLVILAVSSGVVIFASAEWPSVKNGKRHLDALLPDKLTESGIVVHYKAGTNAKSAVSMKRLFTEAKFHLSDLSEKLGRVSKPVHIYVYPDSESKKLWFGGGATDVADVVTPSIHITMARFPHPTLRHELVHAVSSDFAFHGLGFHPNMALTEGLAVALEDRPRELTLDESVAAMVHTKKLPDIGKLFGPMFWTQAGNRAYIVAGSMLSFLMIEFGNEAVRKLYSGASWKSALGVERDVALKRWRKSILKIYDKERFALYAEQEFKQEKVLDEFCPHSKEDLARDRSQGLLTRLRQPVGWQPEADYWQWRVDLEPEDYDARLSLWKVDVDALAKDRIVPTERLQEWATLIGQARKPVPESIGDIRAALLESDIRAIIGDKESSHGILKMLKEFVRTKSVGNDIVRQIETRLFVDENLQDVDMVIWRKYLAGWGKIPSEPNYDESWLLRYLRVRNAEFPIRSYAVLKFLLDAPVPAGFSKSFYVEWYRYIGYRLMAKSQFKDAERAFKKAGERASAGHAPFFKLLQREALFFSENLQQERKTDTP